jgi:hypothetical protein
MAKLISRTTNNLGMCIVDIYRQPGDLYESWDIEPYNDGNPARLPDARYGVDQPDYGDLMVESYTPMELVKVVEAWDLNGWTSYTTSIETIDGTVLAERTS